MRILTLSLSTVNADPTVYGEALNEMEKASELTFISVLDQLEAAVAEQNGSDSIASYMEYIYNKGKYDSVKVMYESLFHKSLH